MTEKWSKITLLALIFSLQLSQLVTAFPVSYIATVEITIKLVYYLHRTDLTTVTPAGKLMNTTRPPLSQPEITYSITRGASVYFYTPLLSAGTIENGTWTLYIWASTASSGWTSSLTVQLHLVTSDGAVEKATIGAVTDVVIDYGYSERTIQISGCTITISSGDRIRLTLHAQTGATNDPKGMNFYYDGYGSYQTLYHETRLQLP
jgi:hypothetical protein